MRSATARNFVLQKETTMLPASRGTSSSVVGAARIGAAADGIEPGLPRGVGLPGGQQGDVQPEAPPQFHGVPQFGVGPADRRKDSR